MDQGLFHLSAPVTSHSSVYLFSFPPLHSYPGSSKTSLHCPVLSFFRLHCQLSVLKISPWSRPVCYLLLHISSSWLLLPPHFPGVVQFFSSVVIPFVPLGSLHCLFSFLFLPFVYLFLFTLLVSSYLLLLASSSPLFLGHIPLPSCVYSCTYMPLDSSTYASLHILRTPADLPTSRKAPSHSPPLLH